MTESAGPKNKKVRHKKNPWERTPSNMRFKGKQLKGETPWWDLMNADFSAENAQPLEKILGRPLKPSWMRLFEIWASGSCKDYRAIVAKLNSEGIGLTLSAVYNLASSAWFKEARAFFFTEKNAELAKSLIDRDGKLVDAYEGILSGSFPSPKMASAVPQLLAKRMEMSPGGTGALIDRGPKIQVNNDNRTQISVTQLDTARFKNMTREERMEYGRTGRLPEGVAASSELIEVNSK